MNSAFAGEYEDAIKSGKPVFLYVYVPYCATCQKFDVVYDKLSRAFKGNCKFLRINAETQYGASIARKMQIMFVPYVRMIDTRREYMGIIEPDCLLDYVCTEKELKQFIK